MLILFESRIKNIRSSFGFLPPFHPPVDPPQIKNHPMDQLSMPPGSTVEFTVTATGAGNLKYKWHWNDASLPGVSGETTNTLKIEDVKKKHQGTYTCTVSNSGGNVTSNSAQLTICKSLYTMFLIQMFCTLQEIQHYTQH